MAVIASWIERVLHEYQTGRSLAIVCSFDGTLTPIVPNPDQATLSESTRALLTSLTRLDRVSVGVLSGRSLNDLRSRIGVPNVWLAGSCGMHIDLLDREIRDAAIPDFDAIADRVVESVAEFVRWFPGTSIERKPGCLSIHYRQLTPLRAACFTDLVRDSISHRIGAPIRIRDASRALEITLQSGWTKREALARMLDACKSSPAVVYAGDGASDLEAITHVNEMDGTSLGIGFEAPAEVQFRYETSAKFLGDLSTLSKKLATLSPCEKASGA